MNRDNLQYFQCPNCESIGTFEEVYCGGHPHIYHYSCSECGLSSPVESDDNEKNAQYKAYIELGNFLQRIYEPVQLLNRLYNSLENVKMQIGTGSDWMTFIKCCENSRNYLNEKLKNEME